MTTRSGTTSGNDRKLSASGRGLAFGIGAVSLLCQAAALAGYTSRFGPDIFSALPLALLIIATILLVMGISRSPTRARGLRITVGLLCLLQFPVLAILAFQATARHDSDTAGGLLFLAGICFVVTAPCLLMLGRPRR